ncbi:hypothetical protein [Pseudomonas lactis]|nr:hypothetical protein [Pseudomonas lactis]
MLADSMTRNPITFIKGPLLEWLKKNSDEGIIDAFWPVPCDRESADFRELCNNGVRLFQNCYWGDAERLDGIFLSNFKLNDDIYFCISSSDQLFETYDPTAFGLIETELHFLQSSAFLVISDFKLKRPIPSRLLNGDTFEDDLQKFFPKITAFRLAEDNTREYLLATYIRVVLAAEPPESPSLIFKDELIALALLIPETDHNWLFFQLLSLITSKRHENLYLELYRLLEFFFPIANIFNLKNQIAYPGAPLELLENCRTQLSWNMNHNTGARAALKYSGTRFAEILSGEAFNLPPDCSREERDKKTLAFKSTAMESLAELRHSLTHQNFKRTTVKRENLIKSTESLLVFLGEAFTAYRRDILGIH